MHGSAAIRNLNSTLMLFKMSIERIDLTAGATSPYICNSDTRDFLSCVIDVVMYHVQHHLVTNVSLKT